MTLSKGRKSTSRNKLATFNIDPSQWDLFKRQAGADGSNASELLKWFISSYLEGEIVPTLEGVSSRGESSKHEALSSLTQKLDTLSQQVENIKQECKDVGLRLGKSSNNSTSQPATPHHQPTQRLISWNGGQTQIPIGR